MTLEQNKTMHRMSYVANKQILFDHPNVTDFQNKAKSARAGPQLTIHKKNN